MKIEELQNILSHWIVLVVLTDTVHHKSTDCCSLRTKGRQHTEAFAYTRTSVYGIGQSSRCPVARAADDYSPLVRGSQLWLNNLPGNFLCPSSKGAAARRAPPSVVITQLQVFICVLLICNEGCVSAAGRIDHTFSCSPPTPPSFELMKMMIRTWFYPARVSSFSQGVSLKGQSSSWPVLVVGPYLIKEQNQYSCMHWIRPQKP